MNSKKEDVRPYHAPPASSGQETADAVKAVLQHSAERDEAALKKSVAKKQPKWMLPLGANLCVLAIYLFIAPPRWVVLDPLEGPPPAEAQQGLRVAMFLQASRIEAYRLQNGRLPERLEDAGSPAQGVEYRVTGNGQYQLVATAADRAILYDSATQSPQEWVGAVAVAGLRGG